MQTPFHEGELAVQRRAGVERAAAQVGRMIGPSIPPEFAGFVARQPFVVAAAPDAEGRIWATLLVGGPGFATAPDDRHLLLAVEAFAPPGARVGILALEAHTRSRIRLNGPAEPVGEGVLVTVEEAFGNCPKYIQRRLPVERLEPPADPTQRTASALDDSQRALVGAADTLFIASMHPQRGADASHRGGRPGFVRVSGDGTSLRFPDYPGNRMFQTLGNLAVEPRAGLLFVDWETGTTLQVTGRAHVVWDDADRHVEFAVEEVRERERAMPARWQLIEPSRLNPPV
jgi:predicted pyridoxine 5'-phosphate oxidase superfamily flavin-nucleotide-binding protein